MKAGTLELVDVSQSRQSVWPLRKMLKEFENA